MAIAKSSMDYIESMKGRKAKTKAQRTAAFNQIKMNSGDQVAAMAKIGQGFIGPVMMRLKYEGIVRNVLTEDVIAPGAVPVYDVADEMGRAYFLEGYGITECSPVVALNRPANPHPGTMGPVIDCLKMLIAFKHFINLKKEIT